MPTPTLRTALVAGATGATGRQLIRLLQQHPDYDRIVVVHHHPTGLAGQPKITEWLSSFDQLESLETVHIAVDDAFCCLGTTLKKAGSKAALARIDRDYVVNFARLARRLGAGSLQVVSSMHAHARSRSFYLRTKGEMEVQLQQLGFTRLNLLRPSVLHGERDERRPAEQLGYWLCLLLSKLPGCANQAPVATRTVAAALIGASRNPPGVQTYPSSRLAALAAPVLNPV
jgi:uncharacterized protein YbjT (DUF2867 family)